MKPFISMKTSRTSAEVSTSKGSAAVPLCATTVFLYLTSDLSECSKSKHSVFPQDRAVSVERAACEPGFSFREGTKRKVLNHSASLQSWSVSNCSSLGIQTETVDMSCPDHGRRHHCAQRETNMAAQLLMCFLSETRL